MSWLPLILAGVLAVVILICFVVVLVGMRQEDHRRYLPESAPTASAGFARRVVGCHVRERQPNSSRCVETRLVRAVPGGWSGRPPLHATR